MRIAVLETVKTAGGFEGAGELPVYERELQRANHDCSTGSFLQSLLR